MYVSKNVEYTVYCLCERSVWLRVPQGSRAGEGKSCQSMCERLLARGERVAVVGGGK